MVFDLLIKYKDGNGNVIDKIVSAVDDYCFSSELNMFYFEKNKYKSFMPCDNIIYFGREFDWNN